MGRVLILNAWTLVASPTLYRKCEGIHSCVGLKETVPKGSIQYFIGKDGFVGVVLLKELCHCGDGF